MPVPNWINTELLLKMVKLKKTVTISENALEINYVAFRIILFWWILDISIFIAHILEQKKKL
jgi:hypothetical protein